MCSKQRCADKGFKLRFKYEMQKNVENAEMNLHHTYIQYQYGFIEAYCKGCSKNCMMNSMIQSYC